MSTELLRIKLNADQINEACIEYAYARAKYLERETSAKVEGLSVDTFVEVVFTKKRVRKAKATTA